jgi:hypothetical protein
MCWVMLEAADEFDGHTLAFILRWYPTLPPEWLPFPLRWMFGVLQIQAASDSSYSLIWWQLIISFFFSIWTSFSFKSYSRGQELSVPCEIRNVHEGNLLQYETKMHMITVRKYQPLLSPFPTHQGRWKMIQWSDMVDEPCFNLASLLFPNSYTGRIFILRHHFKIFQLEISLLSLMQMSPCKWFLLNNDILDLFQIFKMLMYCVWSCNLIFLVLKMCKTSLLYFIGKILWASFIP